MPQAQPQNARALFQLQVLDLEIDAATKEISDLQARMGETEDLSAARKSLADARRRRNSLESTRRELDVQSSEIGAKLEAETRRLYEGTGRTAKESNSIKKEVESLSKRHREFEDKELGIMAQIEPVNAEIATAKSTLIRLIAEWEKNQHELRESRAAAEARLADSREKRSTAAARQSTATMSTYERLRREKAGRAMAAVERNTCLGCRVAIPQVVAQRARLSQEFVYCPHCGRILFFER